MNPSIWLLVFHSLKTAIHKNISFDFFFKRDYSLFYLIYIALMSESSRHTPGQSDQYVSVPVSFLTKRIGHGDKQLNTLRQHDEKGRQVEEVDTSCYGVTEMLEAGE